MSWGGGQALAVNQYKGATYECDAGGGACFKV
jgi:hypothetical protein